MGRPPGSKNKPKPAEPGIGHNSRHSDDRLKSLVARIENLEAEKAEILEGIKEVYAEVKDGGFDTAAVRQIIRIRRQDKDEREAKQALIDSYMHALGMLADLPLGRAALEREGIT